MVRREREGGTRGMDESYARNVLKKGKRFKGDSSSRAGMDEEEEVDMGMYEDKKDRVTAQKRKEIDRAEAVRAHQQFNNAQTKCRLCFSSQGIAKHLVVALGSHTYVDGRGTIEKRGERKEWREGGRRWERENVFRCIFTSRVPPVLLLTVSLLTCCYLNQVPCIGDVATPRGRPLPHRAVEAHQRVHGGGGGGVGGDQYV